MRKILRVAFTLVIVAAGCFGGYKLWDYYIYSPWTRDARVQADVVDIAPDISGFVEDLRVKDNQFVHKGDVLIVIDQARYSRDLARADAVVLAQKANMDMRESEAARRAKLTNLAVSDEEKETYRLTAASVEAAYQQALVDRSTAQLNLDRTVIRAPVNGYVTNLTLDAGQYASVGTKVMALIDSDSYRVSGYFEETKIQGVKPGDPVDIYLMSGGAPLRGHVESLSHGITDSDNPDGPQLLANVAPTFEWVRLAQRIPVRIHIDSVPDGELISSGMTCTVVVEHHVRGSAAVATLDKPAG